ncbi:hypothetical protein I4F81_006027 [Pyropia yezoensis]|uniref:Uncharacterized protein n=1 Tax=Pyropia yezoensis TaxID=2788 RepID=A0ACC3C0Z7_PYRYE|nr:hypothetical protein I4F81_006027 [Neopyropia yezoensis]
MARLCLPSARGTQQGDPLGPLVHALAIHLVLTRLATAHPERLVKGVHDDVVVAAPLEALAAVMRDASALGAAIDAELAPTKCAAWCPTPQAPPAGFVANWRPGGVTQFSVPVGKAEFVSDLLMDLMAEERRLARAVAGLQRSELQTQLLLLRYNLGPRANNFLRALPLVPAAQLAAALDREEVEPVEGLLCDVRDSPLVRQAVRKRMPLPVSMGGVGIGGRTKGVTAAALASRLDAVPRCRVSSPALRALGDALVLRADCAHNGAPGEQRPAVADAAPRRPPPAAPAVAPPDAASPSGVRPLQRAAAAELVLEEGASEAVSMRDSPALAARRAAAPPVEPGLPVLRAAATMPPSDDSPVAGLPPPPVPRQEHRVAS